MSVVAEQKNLPVKNGLQPPTRIPDRPVANVPIEKANGH